MPSDTYFRGNRVSMHDDDLIQLVHFMLLAIERVDTTDPFLNEVACAWHTAASASGYGCINLRLDQLLTSTRRVETIRRIINDARSSINAYGEYIPKEELNKHELTKGYIRDIPVAETVSQLDRIDELLDKGHLGPFSK